MCDSSWDLNLVKQGLDGYGVGDFVNNNKQRNYAGSKTGPKAGAKTKAGDSGTECERESKTQRGCGQSLKQWRMATRRQGWAKRNQ